MSAVQPTDCPNSQHTLESLLWLFLVCSFGMFLLLLNWVSTRRLVGMSRPPCHFFFFPFTCPCVLSSCLCSFVIQFKPLEVNNHLYCWRVLFFLFIYLFFILFYFFMVLLCFAAITMSACIHSHWTLVILLLGWVGFVFGWFDVIKI